MIFNKRNNKKNNAIILGCGRLGSRTAGELSLDDWDVVVMDNNRDAFRLLPSFFGGSTLQANATDIEKLEEAGITKKQQISTAGFHINSIPNIKKEHYKVFIPEAAN